MILPFSLMYIAFKTTAFLEEPLMWCFLPIHKKRDFHLQNTSSPSDVLQLSKDLK